MPTWVIVGASRGIGYQYLKTLSRDPSNTIIGLVRTLGPTEAQVATDKFPNVHILHGDLDDSASLYTAAEKVSALTNNTIDYLIVNGANQSGATRSLAAGDYTGAEKEALLLSELDSCMRTNVVGALYSINAFLPLLLHSTIKKVVCISSGAADPDVSLKTGLKEQLPYSMSKAALNVLVAKFAAQYREQDVKFLALSPGFVLTIAQDVSQLPPEYARVFDSFTEAFRNLNPDLKGPSTSEESVGLQLKVIENLSSEQSGQFLSHFGNKQWV